MSKKKKVKSLDISLQLSLKPVPPVPHYNVSIMCAACTPSTSCEPVNLLIYRCHSFNAADLLIGCICECVSETHSQKNNMSAQVN